MHGRGPASRGHRHAHSYSGSVGQKAQLTSAYQELGRELASPEIKTVGNYTLGRVIGEGSYGKVRLAIHKLTSQRCAVKQVPRSVAASMLTREIHHHRRLHHPNVLQLFEVVATESSIWLVSELCAGGELFDYLVEKGRLHEQEAKRIFGQLCLGVGYIHRQGVVHRDLKLENVLLDERCNVKVADFGFGREFEQRRLMETFCGTTGYAAPEMLAGKKYLGEEVDIWSLGVILYALLTGSLPFDDDDEDVMKRKILVGDYEIPTWLSSESQDLIAGILRMDPRDRLNMRQILGHDWFTKPPPVFSPSPNDFFQQGDFLHHAIPEETVILSPTQEGSSPVFVQEPESNLKAHAEEASAAESVASTASWHSVTSNPDSDAGLGEKASRSETPITSDDADDHATRTDTGALSEANVNSQYVKPSKGGNISRHPSQCTITRSDSRHSIGHHFRPSPLLSASEASSYRFPSTSPNLGDAGPPGSPSLPMPAHSRTPSRTKRRSIGSTMSERVAAHPEYSLPDFVALLDQSSAQLFSSPGERTLLDSLALLGIDTGQMIHSVRNNACDSTGAIWWMLKVKADQREIDAAQDAVSHAMGKSDSMSSLAPSIHQVGNRKQDPTAMNTPEALQERGWIPVAPQVHVTHAPSSTEVLQYGEQDHKESPRKQRIQVPGSARFSFSAPLLANRAGSSTIIGNQDIPPSTDLFVPPSPSRTNAGAGRKTTSSRDVPKSSGIASTKPRSASVSTVSMLQRASTALGVRKEKPAADDKASPTFSSEAGRSTPSLLAGGFFGRKVSSSSAAQETPTAEQAPSVAPFDDNYSIGSGHANPSQTSLPLTPGKPTPPLTPKLELLISGSPKSSPGPSPSSSPHNTASAPITLSNSSKDSLRGSVASKESEAGPSSYNSKGRASKNIFSTFKLWFNEDRRKQKRQRPSSSISVVSPNRTASGAYRPYIQAPSPLQRPPLARIPSNAPSSAGISRRNSSTSARRAPLGEYPSPLLGYNRPRRRSDASRQSFSSANGARTPTSERDHSRPPSAQSVAPISAEVYSAARRRHGRAGSTSSAGSRHSTMLSGSPVATYRRTPAVTQVRRISTPKNRYTHSRNTSNASSAHSASSRRSSLSVPQEGEETIMEDDNENMEDSVELERTKAFKKLSGNADDRPQPMALTIAAVAAVDAMSASPIPDLSLPTQARSGSQQQSNHRNHPHRQGSSGSSHSPAVFVAHRVVNPFGTPNGSHFSNSSHSRTKRENDKPKLRDIFKQQGQDGEDGWVDEEEGLYSGGFGQASSRAVPSTTAPNFGTPEPSRLFAQMPSDIPDRNESDTSLHPMLGEGRYAGVGRSDCAAPASSTGRPRQTAKGPSFRQAATVLEEEEEEEEE